MITPPVPGCPRGDGALGTGMSQETVRETGGRPLRQPPIGCGIRSALYSAACSSSRALRRTLDLPSTPTGTSPWMVTRCSSRFSV